MIRRFVLIAGFLTMTQTAFAGSMDYFNNLAGPADLQAPVPVQIDIDQVDYDDGDPAICNRDDDSRFEILAFGVLGGAGPSWLIQTIQPGARKKA